MLPPLSTRNGRAWRTEKPLLRPKQHKTSCWKPSRNPIFAVASNAALDRLLLDAALRVTQARSDRLAFSSDFSENFKWSCVLVMALITQISLAAVHLNEVRAQIDAMVIFTASIVLVIGFHEGPFQPPLGIRPAQIKLLDIVPDS
jgi:hypothetical protein